MSETASTEILWIGRFTGPKGELAEQIMRQVAPAFAQVKFTMVGGPLTVALQHDLPANVELTGFVEDVRPYLQRASAVIGAGRVALEALQAGKPILAVGENVYHGWIDDTTIDAARASNFGDCDQRHAIDMQRFRADIKRFIDA
ncbi:MAG: glycosyltransferase family 4 protein, partial [Gammaproteobacteria bacterium]